MILFAEDSIKVDEELFLFARDLNMLFSIHMTDGDIIFWGSIPGLSPSTKRATCKLVYWREQIIIVPLMIENIWIYSLKTGDWKSIVIEDRRRNFFGTKFRQAIIYQDFLYLIGGHYPAILKINLASYDISCIVDPLLHYKDKESKELYFRGNCVFKEETLYLASCRENAILIFHLDSEEYEWVEVGGKENRYSGIEWDGSFYWISPRINTPIVKWDGISQIEYEIPFEKRKNEICYLGILRKDNQIVIPALAGSGAETICLTNEGMMTFSNKQYTFFKKTQEGEYLAQDSSGNVIFIDDKGGRHLFSCSIFENKLYVLSDILHIDLSELIKGIIGENTPVSLNTLLKLLNKKDIFSIQEKTGVGTEIWKSLMR